MFQTLFTSVGLPHKPVVAWDAVLHPEIDDLISAAGRVFFPSSASSNAVAFAEDVAAGAERRPRDGMSCRYPPTLVPSIPAAFRNGAMAAQQRHRTAPCIRDEGRRTPASRRAPIPAQRHRFDNQVRHIPQNFRESLSRFPRLASPSAVCRR